MSDQPLKTNDFGAILTIGCVCNGERLACVEPYIFDGPSFDPVAGCADLLDSWHNSQLPTFLSMVSVDLAVVFLQAEGMTDGKVPSRADYAITANTGGVDEPALPTNCCGLIAYYEDPADVTVGKKISVAKTFVPGVPESAVTGQSVSVGQVLLYYAYGAAVRLGFASLASPSQKWWRVLSSPKPRTPGQDVHRIINCTPRGYITTQKRRLVPR